MRLNDINYFPNKFNWANEIKQILDKLGFSYVT